MAQRLATNYANAYFTMNEAELEQFVKLFASDNIKVEVKICDNGDRDIFIPDQSGEIQLTFQREGQRYICESSYVITDLRLANAMRKAMKAFKGHGIVHRIYDSFTVVYHYDEGSVVSIHEVTDDENVPIFENQSQNIAAELEQMYRNTSSEDEIALIREEANKWLDLRNWTKKAAPEKVATIDTRLRILARRLFELEA
ncbi:hypothetical protein [Brevibacillus fulvus]|uniref:Non-ribosomal peptide synthetase module n=1 Tax=Brevibacillus fulvus TaxID=1125967 RepID=A0A938XZI2_9BACL|nr:hypothetical protein [Brevibacillus fulvus]MBM7589281.1 hypothetical protein [Brevibacillus fulvus]